MARLEEESGSSGEVLTIPSTNSYSHLISEKYYKKFISKHIKKRI
jgi:hypothetical protein